MHRPTVVPLIGPGQFDDRSLGVGSDSQLFKSTRTVRPLPDIAFRTVVLLTQSVSIFAEP